MSNGKKIPLNSKSILPNSFIASLSNMDRIPLQVFELAVSCIDVENTSKESMIYLSKKELFDFLNISGTVKHSRLKQVLKRMQEQACFEIKENQNNEFSFKSIMPISYMNWDDYHDEILIEFNHRIMPYLIELKTNFKQYQISELITLKSKYSIILYKWLSTFYNQYEFHREKEYRNKGLLYEYQNPEISIEELRILTNTINEYDRFDNFERWVLKRPVDEINQKTEFIITYDKIKSGKFIGSIKFHIEKKQSVSKNRAKDSRKLNKSIEIEEEQEIAYQKKYFEGIQSIYTKFLLEKYILNYTDVSNTELIVELQTYIYPLYEQLQYFRGIEGVANHLDYVKGHLEKDSSNIVTFLKKLIEHYLLSIKQY